MPRRFRSRLIYGSCCAVAIAAFAPATAGATLTPTVKAPKLTMSSNAPMLEGSKRTVTVSHTCRAKRCDIRISTRPGTATLPGDYVVPSRGYRYSLGQQLSVKVPVSALYDDLAEPRESFVIYADLRTRDGADEQQIEGKKTVYILNAVPPRRYASIFLDKATARVAVGYGYTLAGADLSAVAKCGATCKPEASVRYGCVAVYRGSAGYAYGIAQARADAKARAYAKAGGAPAGAQLVVSACTGAQPV